jgi:hypothetical protein
VKIDKRRENLFGLSSTDQQLFDYRIMSASVRKRPNWPAQRNYAIGHKRLRTGASKLQLFGYLARLQAALAIRQIKLKFCIKVPSPTSLRAIRNSNK